MPISLYSGLVKDAMNATRSSISFSVKARGSMSSSSQGSFNPKVQAVFTAARDSLGWEKSIWETLEKWRKEALETKTPWQSDQSK
jgi:hypothetical protein